MVRVGARQHHLDHLVVLFAGAGVAADTCVYPATCCVIGALLVQGMISV